jgi:hypothetical protein
MDEVARHLNMNNDLLERECLKTFLVKKLREIDAQIFKIGSKHGIKSILELDEKLKKGEIKEEDMMDDFMELDYLESRREHLLKAMAKVH